jgi:hypothetical protein
MLSFLLSFAGGASIGLSAALPLILITMLADMIAHDHLVRRLIPAESMKGARP